jgi:hypothetical protein
MEGGRGTPSNGTEIHLSDACADKQATKPLGRKGRAPTDRFGRARLLSPHYHHPVKTSSQSCLAEYTYRVHGLGSFCAHLSARAHGRGVFRAHGDGVVSTSSS